MADPNQPFPGQSYPYPPQQPAKKRRRIWPWIVIGVPVLLFGACTVAAVSSVGGDEKATVTAASDNGAPAANAGPDFPGKLAKDTAALAGDTITRDDLEYTVTPLQVFEPRYGSTSYLCSDVTIRNVGAKQNDFNGYIDWSMQDPNGAIRDATYAPDVEHLESGQLAPGGLASGSVCFEVRGGAAAPGAHIVLFEDTFSLSSDRIAWINTL
ncbi:DUF4352 domain-containing protein [Rhodococcus sp. NPDC004095]